MEPTDLEDELENLGNFMNPHLGSLKSVELRNQFIEIRDKVKRDIRESPLISTTTDIEGNLVVSLDDMLSYLSLGVLYNSGTESERRVTGVLLSNPTEHLGRRIRSMSEDIWENVCGNAESLSDSNAGREGEFSQGEVVVFEVQSLL